MYNNIVSDMTLMSNYIHLIETKKVTVRFLQKEKLSLKFKKTTQS